MNLENLVRRNIKNLKPYSSARSEFSGAAQIFLDANENSFGSPLPENYSRYPDPLQIEIKRQIAVSKQIKPSEIFIGNGSDEAIDLLFRIFCEPRHDNVLICPPTYGMYEVSAAINDIAVRRAVLTDNFELDLTAINSAVDEQTKLLFVCSPNNPSGNALNRQTILDLIENFRGIVVVDEAYIHFSREKSLVAEINSYPNLVVLQTFSKAWGLAGLRVGLAFANEAIIKYFNKVKPPYNISEIAQQAILEALKSESKMQQNIENIIFEREKLINDLRKFSFITKIYPTDANFILAKTIDAECLYKFLLTDKIVVRNRNNIELCAGCLRITVGTSAENMSLLNSLNAFGDSL